MEEQAASTIEYSKQDRRLVRTWSLGIILLFILVGIFSFYRVRQNKLAENERIQAIIESPTIPLGASYDTAPPPGQKTQPVDVQVGVYVNQIPDFSLRDFLWTADLFVWFKWQGELLDPGESFEIFDGNIILKEKIFESVDGDTHYSRYRVVAEIHQFFDVSRFPLNEFVLTIGLINYKHPVYQLRFVADLENSGASSSIRVLEGISIPQTMGLVKLIPYQTTFGDPALPVDYNPTFSTYLYGLWLTSPGLTYYLKLLLALYISVLIAMSVFFIKPTDVDPRFGLGVGGLFAAVANAYIISSLLPPSGGMVMVDMINAIGISVIFLTIVESILSLYLYDIREKIAISRRLDRASFVIFLVGFICINIGITVAALA